MAAPSAPINVTGTAGDGQAVISFAASADGGKPVTSFTVTAHDTTVTANGGQTATGAASPITVTALTNGDAYTFTVTATNADGTSPASNDSTVVVPQATTPTTTTEPYPNALKLTVTKPVNVVQLTDEISAAVGKSVQVAVGGSQAGAPISSDNPATVYIIPNTVNAGLAQQALTNHVADPNYGTPAHIREFNTVMQKVIDNFDVTLTADEQATAIKGLLLRYSVVQTVPQPSGTPIPVNP